MGSAQVLLESSLAKVRSWPIAGNQSCHHSRSWGLHSVINTQGMLSEQQQSSMVFLLAYCGACYVWWACQWRHKGRYGENCSVKPTHLILYSWGSYM